MARKIESLDLEPRIKRKLALIVDTDRLRVLKPHILAAEFNLSDADYEKISCALTAAGERPLDVLVRPAPKPTVFKAPKGCVTVLEERPGMEPDVECGMPRMKSKQTCEWHWLLKQPIAVQIVAADQRRAKAELADGFVERKRVPEKEWPDGTRWCSECQGFVPLFYAQGSRCKAHNSRAAHASMVQRVYDLTPAEYDGLLAWQRGRCYICQQIPRSKRLAVDHDHVTGEVRGLLCANDEWGCNVTLRRLLNNPEMARRALAYVERWPLQRMREGEAPVTLGSRPRPAHERLAALGADTVEVDADAAIREFFGA